MSEQPEPEDGKRDAKWILEEFARARKRIESLPPHARPRPTKPNGSKND